MGLCWVGVNAQNEKTVTPQKVNAESIKASKSLNTKALNKDNEKIEKLTARVKKLEYRNEELYSLLKAEKQEGKAAKYKQQIKKLRQDSINLSNKLTTMVAVTELNECKKQVETLTGQHGKDNSTIVSLQDKLKELQDFCIKRSTLLAESVGERWLNKSYSAIDVNELEMDFQQCEKFTSADHPEITNAKKQLKVLLDNSRLYQKGVNAINSEYNAEVVESLETPMHTLCDHTKNADVKSDVEYLYWQLTNYGTTVEIFQDVIGEVNKAIEGQSTHKAAWPLVNAALKKQEDDSEYITAIQKIPWLAKQYEEYFKALKTNCMKRSPVEEIIMGLKPLK